MKIEHIKSKHEKLAKFFCDDYDTVTIVTAPLILTILVVHIWWLVLVYKLETKNDEKP